MTFSWADDTRPSSAHDGRRVCGQAFERDEVRTRTMLHHSECLVADAICAALSDGPFDVTVAGSFDEAVSIGSASDASVVDMRLQDACDLLHLLSAAPRCRALVALADDDHRQVRAAYEAGAHECVMASDAFDRLVGALTDANRPPTAGRTVRSHPWVRPSNGAAPRLTARELEVVEGLLAGESTKALASRLQVSHATARTHVQSVLMKLGAHTRLEAVALVSPGRGPSPRSHRV